MAIGITWHRFKRGVGTGGTLEMISSYNSVLIAIYRIPYPSLRPKFAGRRGVNLLM